MKTLIKRTKATHYSRGGPMHARPVPAAAPRPRTRASKHRDAEGPGQDLEQEWFAGGLLFQVCFMVACLLTFQGGIFAVAMVESAIVAMIGALLLVWSFRPAGRGLLMSAAVLFTMSAMFWLLLRC